MNKYLDQLVYKAEDYRAILRHYVTNMRVVALVLIALLLGGIVSFFTLPRTLNPEIKITIVTVVTALPGATPADVEELVTIPLEDEIETVDDLDVVTSSSREGLSTIIVQFVDGTEQSTALSDVQNAVATVADLPEDATDPTVDLVDFEDEPILRMAVASDSDPASLNRFATDLKDALEAESIIDRVEVSGIEEQEVQILLNPESMNALGIDVQTVARAVQATTNSFPAGSVETETSSFGLTIDRTAVSVADVRRVQIVAGGQRYALGEIAVVTESPEPAQPTALVTAPGGENRNAVTLSVYRIIGSKIADATVVSEEITETFFAAEYARQFELITIFDMNADIEEQFSDLFRNLTITVFLVFLTLLVFVGIRQALVAALSIPLVFMAAFIAMRLFDISLNFLSVFSLLLSLGLLVDVTIVIISAMTSYYRRGSFNPMQTGLLVWKDFLATLSVTTLTTVWAFVPLLLAGGIIGEFIKPIPVIVSAILVSSVLIGFFIILPLMIWLLDFYVARRVKVFFALLFFVITIVMFGQILAAFGVTLPGPFWLVLIPLLTLTLFAFGLNLKRAGHSLKKYMHKTFRKTEKVSVDCLQNGLVNTEKLENIYRTLLNYVVSRRHVRIKVVAMVVIFFVFSFALVPLGFVKNVFFEGDDLDTIYVSVELPLGTKQDVSFARAQEFLPELSDVPHVTEIQTEIGAGLDPEEGLPVLGQGAHKILFTLQLVDGDERAMDDTAIVQFVRDLDAVQTYPHGELSISEINDGPPAGADVTIKLVGEDLIELDRLAQDVKAFLRDEPGVSNVKQSIVSGTAKIVFVPNAAQLAVNGLTAQDLGLQLRTFGSGFTIDEDVAFSDTSDTRDVVLRMSADTQEATSLGRLRVQTGQGVAVPLSTLGSFELRPNPTVITREDGDRTISVTATVDEGFNAGEINQKVGAFADGDLNLPANYGWETGGANEENNESVQSILQAMLLAFILIFLTLIIQLNSYRKSFIVLLVIPLAISGVFIVFALVGLPLSFPSLIGILALFGIVINNSIIIIDQINKNLREKIDFHDAVLDGAASRLEPILMSSLTTIIGLLPITLTQPIWLGLGSAIIAGLMFSGIIMLFFIPTVYYMMFHTEYGRK